METEHPKLQAGLVIFFLLVVAGGATDLAFDRPTTWWSLHVGFEVGLMLISIVFAVLMFRGWRDTTNRLHEAEAVLTVRSRERDEWRASAQKALEGMGRAIDQQFHSWELTPSEREIALMLLQGLGHKEIAARTGRSERTVRQHAATAYQKAGLAGRAELAAFFLQDLVLPNPGKNAATT
ncbi:MAG: LuxR C-terminal-related transcriptional regulator [Gemmatimonadaceae bacterium]